MSISLRAGLYFARTGGRTIFLDAPRNRYFCLPAQAAKEFDAFLDGEAPEAGSLLHETGILVPDHFSYCREPAPHVARTSLLDLTGRSTWTDVACLMSEFALARAHLALAPGRTLMKMVRRRASWAWEEDSKEDPARAADAYRGTSRWAASHDRCFPWGLALLHFCRDRGIPAECVIGVSARPFRAHCWVQSGGVLINDRYDHVRDFEPILVL